jgi:hypothetical protein
VRYVLTGLILRRKVNEWQCPPLQFQEKLYSRKFVNTGVYRPVVRQRPRNKQEDNSCVEISDGAATTYTRSSESNYATLENVIHFILFICFIFIRCFYSIYGTYPLQKCSKYFPRAFRHGCSRLILLPNTFFHSSPVMHLCAVIAAFSSSVQCGLPSYTLTFAAPQRE